MKLILVILRVDEQQLTITNLPMRLQLKQAKVCNAKTTKLNYNKSKCQRLISKMHQMRTQSLMHQMRTQSTSLSNHLTAGNLEKEIESMFISTVRFNKSTSC